MSNIQKRVTSETGTATDVVSLADVKTFCRVDFSADDDLLTDEIAAAVKLVEDHCSISLLAKTVEVVFNGSLDLWLPYGPVDSSSISLVDANSTAVIPVVLGDEFPRLIYDQGYNESNFTLTYDTTVYDGTVPADIKTAIKRLVYFNYVNRGFASNKLIAPESSESAFRALQKHIKVWI